MTIRFNEVNNFNYTNYRGEKSVRRIIPLQLEFGRNECHPIQQWLLFAWDCDKRSTRHFALNGIEVQA